MRKFAAVLVILAALLPAPVRSESVSTSPGGVTRQQIGILPYPPGRYISLTDVTIATGNAVATLDTVVYLVPFVVQAPLTISEFGYRVSTGAGSSAVKIAVWAANPTTRAPTGTPIFGSNTGQATTSNNSNAMLTGLSQTLQPGLYWAGAAFTTAAPQMVSIQSNQTALALLYGRSAMTTATESGFSAVFAYAGNIMTLDLTGATLTTVTGTSGVPVPYMLVAP